MSRERKRHAKTGRGAAPEEGQREQYVVSRPDVTVLGAEALVPRDNVVRPAPNRFSHVLEQDQPYWFDRAEPHPQPDGVLAAGTPVVVLREEEEGEQCRVVTGSGLYVSVDRASVGRLPHDDG